MWQFIAFLCLSNIATLYFYWVAIRQPFIHPLIRRKMTRIATMYKVNDTPDEVFAQTVVIVDRMCSYFEQGCTVVVRDSKGNEFPVAFSPDWSTRH
jgi:hypothetical protein